MLQCVKDNILRMSKLKRHKDERTKKKRIEHKKHRAEDQSKRYGQIFL